MPAPKNTPVTFRGRPVRPTRGIFTEVDVLREALAGAVTYAEVLRNLGLRDAGARRAQLRAAVQEFGLQPPARERLRDSDAVVADEARVRRAVAASSSVKGVLEHLGLSLSGKNYTALRNACAIYDIVLPERDGRRRASEELPRYGCYPPEEPGSRRGTRKTQQREGHLAKDALPGVDLFTRETLELAVARSVSAPEALAFLGLRATTKNRKDLRLRCAELGLGEHLDTMRSRRADRDRQRCRWGDPDVLLVAGSALSTARLRRLVLRHGLVEYRCAACELDPTWKGRDLTLILDHINGDCTDNRLENLRFLCPNCESQQETTGSRNGKSRKQQVLSS